MADKLSSSGFVRRAREVFSVALNEDASGWVALTTTSYRGSGNVYVTPTVAVVHHGVNRVLKELSPRVRPYRKDSPTIGIPLTALVPGSSSTDWVFEQTSDLEPRTSALAATVRAHALPFMHQYEDLSEVIMGLRLMVAGRSESVAKRLAVALLLRGDTSAALSELDAFASSTVDRTDPAADDFRMFDQDFRKYVATQSTDPA
ncbi:MAG: hypothetical protein ACRYG2_20335 [Janthinobacterium lividum]